MPFANTIQFWRKIFQFSILNSFKFADSLRHRSHRAEGAPGAGTEEQHEDEADEGRSEHEAVEAEAELGDPIGEEALCVCPAPGNIYRPEELDDLPKAFRAGSDEICLEKHVGEHRHEERQKSVAEPR